jgi:hypothetical protein
MVGIARRLGGVFVTSRLGFLVAPLALSGCLVRTISPPAPPLKQMPLVDVPASPPAGSGRVVVSTDVPARVGTAHRQIRSATDMRSDTSLDGGGSSCDRTPCVLTLPYGETELRFEGTDHSDRTSTANVNVRSDLTVVNHTLGKSELGNSYLYGLGLIAVAVSGVLLTRELSDSDMSAEVKTAELFFSGAFAVGGLAAIFLTTRTEQQGATTQWMPNPEKSSRVRELDVAIHRAF